MENSVADLPNAEELNKSAAIWTQAKDHLKSELDPQIYYAFIEGLEFVSLNEDHGVLTISSPSRFLTAHIERSHIGKILAAVRSTDPKYKDLAVKIVVVPKSVDTNVTQPVVIIKKGPVQIKSDDSSDEDKINGLNPRYTFHNFVVGNSNQFCHAAAMRVAEEPGQSYNPLFIYGGVGLGKTHLLHAIGNAALAKNPKTRILYLSAESFTNELIIALRQAKMDDFKRRLRDIEILLIDDIQFISGKERTQEEFFHTFNALYGAKHQIVISSDTIPQNIVGIEERLQTRFAWGLIADIQSPDFETRVAILKKKAASESFILPNDVAAFIAENVSSNVRELEGALTRINAVSTLQSVPLTLSLAENTLRSLIQPKSVRVSISDIKNAVANHFDIKQSDLSSKRRNRNISFPRHIAMYLCRKLTTASYLEIGENFGGRDHSSVIHAAGVVSVKLKSDFEVKSIILEIERRLSVN